MAKKQSKHIKQSLQAITVGDNEPKLEETQLDKWLEEGFVYGIASGNSDAAILARNHQKIELAKLKQDREVANKNLLAQHRIMIATLLTALAAVVSAIMALVIAFSSKPPQVIISTGEKQQVTQQQE